MDSDKIDNIIQQLKRYKPDKKPIYESTLLEVMNVLKKEEQHSNFIYWALTSLRGENNNFILIDEIIKALDLPSKLTSNNKLVEISKEKKSNHGSIDIYIGWSNYKLLIENKVLSKEGDEQCKKYLEDYDIQSEADGRLIFLTLNGSNPKSLEHDDSRFIPLSYGELLDILKSIKTDKKNEYFISDYIVSVERILGIAMRDKDIKGISKSTKLLFENFNLLYKDAKENSAYYNALNETQAIIERLKGLLKEKLEKEVDGEINREVTFSTHLNTGFYKKKWAITDENNISYFIGFFYERAKGRRLLNGYNHCFGIRVKGEENIPEKLKNKFIEFRNGLNKNIREDLKKCGVIKIDKKKPNDHWVYTIQEPQTNFGFIDGEGFDDWMSRVVGDVVELAKKATPILDKCVDEYK